MEQQERFKVVITAIVVRDGKFPIMQRSLREKRFPARWTVPGGKLDSSDYTQFAKDTPHYWYNVLERALKREVREEAGIEIQNIRYVTSLASADPEQDPSLVISCLADYAGGTVRPSVEMADFAWVNLAEARQYDLIEGIGEELEMAERMPGSETSNGAADDGRGNSEGRPSARSRHPESCGGRPEVSRVAWRNRE